MHPGVARLVSREHFGRYGKSVGPSRNTAYAAPRLQAVFRLAVRVWLRQVGGVASWWVWFSCSLAAWWCLALGGLVMFAVGWSDAVRRLAAVEVR